MKNFVNAEKYNKRGNCVFLNRAIYGTSIPLSIRKVYWFLFSHIRNVSPTGNIERSHLKNIFGIMEFR